MSAISDLRDELAKLAQRSPSENDLCALAAALDAVEEASGALERELSGQRERVLELASSLAAQRLAAAKDVLGQLHWFRAVARVACGGFATLMGLAAWQLFQVGGASVVTGLGVAGIGFLLCLIVSGVARARARARLVHLEQNLSGAFLSEEQGRELAKLLTRR